MSLAVVRTYDTWPAREAPRPGRFVVISKEFGLLDHSHLRRWLTSHQRGSILLKVCPRALRVFASKPVVVVRRRDDDQKALFFPLAMQAFHERVVVRVDGQLRERTRVRPVTFFSQLVQARDSERLATCHSNGPAHVRRLLPIRLEEVAHWKKTELSLGSG